MQNPQVAPILQRPIRRWKSHKIVEAEKITGIEPQIVHNQHPLILGDGLDAPRFVVNNEFRDKHDPKVGDYLVKYSDGYVSVSPSKAFEEGYHLFDEASDPQSGLTFGLALEALKNGHRISRKGWNGKGMFLFLLPGGTVPKTAIHDPKLREVIDAEIDGDTFEALPSIRMWTTNSTGRRAVLTGWLASQTDMLSEDWTILD